MKTRRSASLLALALFSALVGSCRQNSRQACAAGLVCIRAGNISDPGTLDPGHAVVKQDQTVIDDLLLGLTTFDAEGRPVPGLATDWAVSDDKLTWTFHLRPALWSDGERITAGDVVFSMRRLADPATAAPYSGLLTPVENGLEVILGKLPPERLGVDAPDPMTVRIRLRQPTPYLPDLLAHYGVVPVPEHAVRQWGEQWTKPGHYVSSGPFRLVSWQLGDRIVLERNPRFYDAASVCLDRVDYIPVGDAIVAEHLVKTGGLDVHASFASDRLRYLRGAGGMADYIHVFPFADLIYIVFRTTDPAVSDARVRQALGMALDRAFIADRLLNSGQQAATAVVPTLLETGAPVEPAWAEEPLATRQGKARELLAAAGYGPDHPLRLTLKTSFGFGNIPVAVQADWRAVGVESTVAREDTSVFFSDLTIGAYQVGLTDWIADYPDPGDFLDLLRGDEGDNYAGFDDADYDRMVQRAEDASDPDARARLFHLAEARILQHAPIAALYLSPSHNLVSPRVTGWKDNVNDVHPMRWVCVAGRNAQGREAERRNVADQKTGSNSAAR